jgi:hypothetical protein
MKCITWLKLCHTNLIYLHHPQADNSNESAFTLVVGGEKKVRKSKMGISVQSALPL